MGGLSRTHLDAGQRTQDTSHRSCSSPEERAIAPRRLTCRMALRLGCDGTLVGGVRSRALVISRCFGEGFHLEYATLGWKLSLASWYLATAATAARSVALAGFGLDSLIEISASTVVIWELSGTGEARQRRALRLIGLAFDAPVDLPAHPVHVGHPRGIPPSPLAPWASPGRLRPQQRCLPSPLGRRAPVPQNGQSCAHHRRSSHPYRRGPGDSRPRRARAEPGAGLVVGRPGGWLRSRLLRSPRGARDLLALIALTCRCPVARTRPLSGPAGGVPRSPPPRTRSDPSWAAACRKARRSVS